MIIFCYSLTWCRSNWNIVCLLLLRTSNLVHFSKKGEIRKIELPDSIQPFFLASTNEQVAWCEKECRFKRKSDKWDFDQKHYLAVFIVRKTLLWKSFWLVNVWRALVHKHLKLSTSNFSDIFLIESCKKNIVIYSYYNTSTKFEMYISLNQAKEDYPKVIWEEENFEPPSIFVLVRCSSLKIIIGNCKFAGTATHKFVKIIMFGQVWPLFSYC